MTTTNVLHAFTNPESGMTAFVVQSVLGGFGVSLRDDDSGEFCLTSIHGIKTIESAIAKAKEVLS